MIDGKVITVHIGDLNSQAFEKHPIWCEYYEPKEIDELIALGENSSFLYNELLKKNDDSGGQIHPYYSLPTKFKVQREFLFIKGSFYTLSKKISGYAVLTAYRITTICIFHQDDIYDLYLNDDFGDDNYNTILEIFNHKCTKNLRLSYELSCNNDICSNAGDILIPCREDT